MHTASATHTPAASPVTPRTVLVLGASGRLGLAAARAFAEAGWRVWAQARHAPAQGWPAGVTPLALAPSDTDALARAAHGASVVVYGVNPVYTAWRALALPLFEQGLAVARALGATLMLPGNVYAYGSRLPGQLDESTPEAPDHEKAHIRSAMEQRLREASQAGPLQGVVIRAGDFFGSGSGTWLDLAIARDIRRGRLAYPGPRDRAHAWAYLPDLARAFVAVAEARAAQGRGAAPAFEALHFAGHTATGDAFLAALDEAAAGLGLRPPGGFRVGGMPWGLIRAGGLVVPMWRELARVAYLWERPHALVGTRLAARVALPPATPLAAALRHSLLDLGLGTAPAPATRAATA